MINGRRVSAVKHGLQELEVGRYPLASYWKRAVRLIDSSPSMWRCTATTSILWPSQFAEAAAAATSPGEMMVDKRRHRNPLAAVTNRPANVEYKSTALFTNRPAQDDKCRCPICDRLVISFYLKIKKAKRKTVSSSSVPILNSMSNGIVKRTNSRKSLIGC